MQRVASMLMMPVLALSVGPALGQGTDDDILEQIIVTAQKRAVALQDVPFSVGAATEQQIRDSGASNIVDLGRNFAGLAIADLGPGQSQISIRGISAGQVIRDQPGVKEQVGVYLDESAISIALFTPDLELYDLDRFEVLRGPQGTLFGAGSLSGTLRYITAQPRLNEFEGSVELTALEGAESDFGGNARGAINIPLGDKAAVRIVGYRSELPGFIDAVRPDGSVEEDVDTGDKTGGRIAFTYKPNDDITITPRIVYQELDTDGFPRVDVYNILGNQFTTTEPAVTLGGRRQFTQLEEGIEDDFALADLNVEIDFGDLTLTSVTSYTDREVTVTRDATSLTGSVSFGPPFNQPSNIVRLSSPLIDNTDLDSISQELRLSSNANEKFQWLVGAFYQDVDREYGQNLPTPGFDAATGQDNSMLNSITDSPFFSNIVYDFKQFAVFTEGTYRFTDKLSTTLGVRYYDFDEDRLLNFGGTFAVVTVNSAGSTESDGVSPRAIVAYDFTDDVQVTAQVSRGFRLGGINDPINLPTCNPQDRVLFGALSANRQNFDDEKITNYELGAKTQFADRSITFNVSAFYSDIEDLQAGVDAGSCSSRLVFNVPDSRSIGLEAELFARVGDNWDFGISATAVDAELRSTVSTPDANGNQVIVGGLRSGNRLPTAPELSAVASVGYKLPFGAGFEYFANFTVQYVGESFSTFADNTPNAGLITRTGTPGDGSAPLFGFGNPNVNSLLFDVELEEYAVGNLRFGVTKDKWEVAALVNNISDEQAFLAVDRERGRSARLGFITNMPRTYGLTVRRTF